MSVQLLDEVRRCSTAPPPARLVLAWIAFHHHHLDPTRTIALDAEQLGDEVGCGRTALYGHLKTLYALGELVKLDGGGGRGKVTRWRIPELSERESYARRWRSAERPSGDRPIMAAAKPSGRADGIEDQNPPLNRPEKRPDVRTVSSRLNSEVLEEKRKTPPNPPASGGESEQSDSPSVKGLRLRALGTNPRAVAKAQAADARIAEARASLASMRPVEAADRPLIDSFLAGLEASVSESTWNIWLSRLEVLAVDLDGTLVLSAPSDVRSWLTTRFGRVLEANAVSVGSKVRIASEGEDEVLRCAA